MKKQHKEKDTRLVNILLIIFRGLYFLTVLSLAFIALFAFLAILVGKHPIDSMSFNFPVFFSMIENSGEAIWNDQTITPFKINQTLGIISLSNIPSFLLIVYSLLTMLAVVFGLQAIRLSIQILESVKFKKFFLSENAVRLKWIALLNIGAFLSTRLNYIFTSNYLANKIELTGIYFENLTLNMIFANTDIVIFNLFLLIIAQVFKVGAEMKNEQDLTI